MTHIVEGTIGQARTDVAEVVVMSMSGGEMYPFWKISTSLAKIVAACCRDVVRLYVVQATASQNLQRLGCGATEEETATSA